MQNNSVRQHDPHEITTRDHGDNLQKRQGEFSSHSQRLGGWLLLLAGAVALLVLAGGIVRISGSGLSIPDWPLINGSLLPPFSAAGWQTVYNTYYLQIHGVDVNNLKDTVLMSMGEFKTMFAIEYTHRLLVSLVTILFLAIAVQVWRLADLRAIYRQRLSGMAVLLLTQAILGGIVVKLDLKAEFVAAHLGLAFAFFGLALWTALQMLRSKLPSSGQHTQLYRLAWVTLGLVYLQVISGGLVAGTHAGYLFNTWPKMGETLVPAGSMLWGEGYRPAWLNFIQNPVLIQFMHRWWAMVAVITVLSLLVMGMRAPISRKAQVALRALASVAVLQLLLGITTLVTHVQPVIAVMHLMMGLMLFAKVLWVTFELRYGE